MQRPASAGFCISGICWCTAWPGCRVLTRLPRPAQALRGPGCAALTRATKAALRSPGKRSAPGASARCAARLDCTSVRQHLGWAGLAAGAARPRVRCAYPGYQGMAFGRRTSMHSPIPAPSSRWLSKQSSHGDVARASAAHPGPRRDAQREAGCGGRSVSCASSLPPIGWR